MPWPLYRRGNSPGTQCTIRDWEGPLTAPPLFTLTVWRTIAAFVLGSIVVFSVLSRCNRVSKLSLSKRRLNLENKYLIIKNKTETITLVLQICNPTKEKYT
jgi:hypothetical protein